MMVCCSRPMPPSERTSRTSRSRHGRPFRRYSASPERNSVRVMVTSRKSRGRVPAELSMVRVTSAIASAGRWGDPAKMTSSIRPPRSERGPCSPSTQEMASTTLDLPEPLGPTMTLIPGSSASVVLSAKDLNPRTVRDFRNIGSMLAHTGGEYHACDSTLSIRLQNVSELVPLLAAPAHTKIVLVVIDGLGG